MKRINGKVIGDSITTPMPIPDYNQNDPKKADYIKNRPFYESEAQIMSEDIPNDFGLPFLNTQFPEGDYNIGDVLKIQLTNNDTGEVFEEGVIIDVLHDNGFPSFNKTINAIIFDTESSSGNIVCASEGATGNFSFKIFKGAIVPIDEKFLPKSVITEKNVGNYFSHTVPYIYSSEDKALVAIDSLDSGAYVLQGVFKTSTGALFYGFSESPRLCQIERPAEHICLVTWFTATTGLVTYGVSHLLFILDGEIVTETQVGLNPASHDMVVDLDSDVGTVPTISAVKNYIKQGNISTIRMTDAEGKTYNISVGTDGNIKATPV